MTASIHRELYGDLVGVASRPGFADWQAMVRSIGGCAQPVHLWGHCRTLHTGTGEVFSQREPGRLLVACGNRRQARCPSCSETYRADTFQLCGARGRVTATKARAVRVICGSHGSSTVTGRVIDRLGD
jgi:hypothetical protein